MSLKEKIEKEITDMNDGVLSAKNALTEIYSSIKRKIEESFVGELYDEIIVSGLEYYLIDCNNSFSSSTSKYSNKIIENVYIGDDLHSFHLCAKFYFNVNSSNNEISNNFIIKIRPVADCFCVILENSRLQIFCFHIKENSFNDSTFESWLWSKIHFDLKMEILKNDGFVLSS